MSNTLATALTQMANQSQFKTYGLKGAPVYETTQNPLIDAYIKLNLASTKDETSKHMSNIMTYINTSQDPESLVNTLITLMYKRDPRNGEGFRDVTFWSIIYLYDFYPETITKLVTFLPDYGYIRDFWKILSLINEKDTYQSKSQEQFKHFRYYNPLVQSMTNHYIGLLRKDETTLKEYLHSSSQQTNPHPPQLSWAAKYFPRPKGSEDRQTYWYIPVNSSVTNEPKYLHKQSLSFYLTQALLNPERLTNLKGSDRVPNPSPKELQRVRKFYTTLTKHCKVPEQLMTSPEGKWDEIDFNRMPSRCRTKNTKAIMNITRKGNEQRSYDQHRIDCAEKFINEFLPSMLSKSKTTNAPPDIMKKIKENRYSPAMLPVLNAEFEIIVNNAHTQIEDYQKDLLAKAQQIHGPDFELPKRRNVLSLIDISGSMEAPASGKSGKSSLSCMDVSISLGYLTARMNTGPYKNIAMSFSESPHIINFNKPNDEVMNAQEAYNEIHKHCGYTTDIIKAYQLILDIATENQVPQEEIPDIAVFSDMGFDRQMIANDPGFRQNYSSGSYSWSYSYTTENMKNYGKYWDTTNETITKMFQAHGYEPPQMYYVDLNANSYEYHNPNTDGGFQAQATRKGVSQMRGYTQSLFQFIMTGSLVLATLPDTDTDTDTETSTTSTKEQQHRILAQKKSTLDDFLGMVNKTLYDPIRLMCSNELSEKQLANYHWTPPPPQAEAPNTEATPVVDDGFEILGNTIHMAPPI